MKTKAELIIEALKPGKDLSLSEIATHLSKATGKPVKTTDFSSVLSQLSKADKTELGNFIQRRKKPKNPYKYKLVPEALEMTIVELIDLTRKNGKNRFNLKNAVEKYPGVKKYVKKSVVKKSVLENVEAPKTELIEKTEEPQIEESVDIRQNLSDQDLNKVIAKIFEQGINVTVNLNIRFY